MKSIELKRIVQFGEEMHFFWHHVSGIDYYLVSLAKLTENGYSNWELIKKTKDPFHIIKLTNFDCPFIIKIVAHKNGIFSDPKEIPIISDAIGEGKKISFAMLNDSMKQICTICSIIIAGSIAFMPIFYRNNTSPQLTFWSWSVSFLSFSILGSLSVQLYLANESFMNRFNVHKAKVRLYTAFCLFSFVSGIIFIVLFFLQNKQILLNGATI